MKIEDKQPEKLDYDPNCNMCVDPNYKTELRLEGVAELYDWKDIDDERFRIYIFPGGHQVKIQYPLKLHISDSKGHRLFDSDGICHYIPTGWIHLLWLAKEGEPHFRF